VALDDDLVRAARVGDRAALEQLLRRHVDRVHALARRLLGNEADADDAAQEALIAVVRGLDRFDGRSSFTTWLYRVTTNACLDELRRRSRRPGPLAEDVDHGRHDPMLSDGIADRAEIDAALATLPPEFRAAVVLRDLCDLDYAEIAAVLGIPAGTVRSRIARGRALLARRLGNHPDLTRRQSDDPS